jgi:hypothetical protein
LKLAGLAPNVPTACPVPASVTLAVAVKFVLCPGDSVTGTLIRLVLNPAPVAVALVIVTALPPELVTVPV